MPDLAAAEAQATADRRRWIALGVVCLAMFMNTIDGSVVNVALPAIQTDLHIAQADLTWVINAYLITFGSFLLLAGRLGDLVGRKRVFLAGVSLFTLASVACGLAQDEKVLIAARFVQGLGGAVSSSVIIAMIVSEFPEPAERAKAMSAYIFVAVGGGSVGLLVGGLITQSINWHWIFFINIPIGAITLLLGRSLLADSAGIGLDKGVDVLGSIAVTAALMLGIYAIVTTPDNGWGSAHTLVCGGAGLFLLVVFFALQARIANPIMPPCAFCASTASRARASCAGCSPRASSRRLPSALSTSSACAATARCAPASRSCRSRSRSACSRRASRLASWAASARAA